VTVLSELRVIYNAGRMLDWTKDRTVENIEYYITKKKGMEPSRAKVKAPQYYGTLAGKDRVLPPKQP